MDVSREILGLLGLALFAFALGLGAALYLLPRRADPEGYTEALLQEVRGLRAAAAARDKAEAASEAKSRFLATVSHEIRTPLNGVLGLAQLLSMTRLEAEQASYVDSIRDCARALAQLVDDILDYSKIEAGRLELRREEFALAPLVEGVVELLAPRAQGKGLEIASHVAAEAPERIVGDPARLRQVLINLAGNAVNFTQKGGVGVSVAPFGDGALRFVVEDTGPGVPAAARAKIFEEFEQAEPLATRTGGGAGLGLAIARRLVAKMGGALALEASSEAGSRFVFTLPAGAGRADRSASTRRPERADRRAEPFRRPFSRALSRRGGRPGADRRESGGGARSAGGARRGAAANRDRRLRAGARGRREPRRERASLGRRALLPALLALGEARAWRGGAQRLRRLAREAGARGLARRAAGPRGEDAGAGLRVAARADPGGPHRPPRGGQ